MPISYSIDVNFNITIPNFTGVVNISSTSNYTKAQNKANREGANNNSQDGAGNNSEDNNRREDNNNREDISGVRT